MEYINWSMIELVYLMPAFGNHSKASEHPLRPEDWDNRPQFDATAGQKYCKYPGGTEVMRANSSPNPAILGFFLRRFQLFQAFFWSEPPVVSEGFGMWNHPHFC